MVAAAQLAQEDTQEAISGAVEAVVGEAVEVIEDTEAGEEDGVDERAEAY